MKPGIYHNIKLTAAFFIAFLLSRPAIVYAQSDTTKAPEVELLSPSLDLVGTQKGDNSVDLAVTMKAKFKGSTIKLPYLKVKFFAVTDSGENELGHIITNKVGKGVFNVNPEQLVMNGEGKVNFKAVFDGNKSMESADGEVGFKRAKLILEPVKGDSLNSVFIKLVDLTSGTETPIPEVELGLFVKRSFFPLKIGEGTTDTEGAASIDVPAKLPGDPQGNITLMAKIDENETYGNLETSLVQQWGVAVSNKSMEMPKALWSTHPPTWMLITFIILMTTVWGHYFVIIWELIRLRKEEPHIAPE